LGDDAGDREWLPVDEDRPPDDGRIGVESLPPIRAPQHHDRVSAVNLSFVTPEETTLGRPQPEHRKEIAGDVGNRGPIDAIAGPQTGEADLLGRDIRKDARAVAIV